MRAFNPLSVMEAAKETNAPPVIILTPRRKLSSRENGCLDERPISPNSLLRSDSKHDLNADINKLVLDLIIFEGVIYEIRTQERLRHLG
jgi:hypothetical protein